MTGSPFRAAHHVCIVVRDLDRAASFYESVGIGPWQDFPSLAGFTELCGIDREALLGLRYKFVALDNLHIQLCQPGDGDSPQRRFLDTHGEGVFHIGFSVPNCDQAEATLTDLGLSVLLAARLPGRGGFTYFDTRDEAGVTLQVRSLRPSS